MTTETARTADAKKSAAHMAVVPAVAEVLRAMPIGVIGFIGDLRPAKAFTSSKFQLLLKLLYCLEKIKRLSLIHI